VPNAIAKVPLTHLMDHTPTFSFPGLSFGTAFLFGLLGSAHCFGMCGPLVSLYTTRLSPSGVRIAHRQHLLYNLGRVIVYTDLGLLFGGAGQMLSIVPWLSGILGLLAGGFVMSMGVHFLGVGGIGTWMDQALARPTAILTNLWRKLAALTNSPGIILLGGLHGLLPCPLLYVMFSSAIAIQDPLQSGLLLFSFSLGTVPMMWGIGTAAHYLTPQKRVAFQRLFGGLILLWGTVLLVHGIERLR
jgi:hypothetical protein